MKTVTKRVSKHIQHVMMHYVFEKEFTPEMVEQIRNIAAKNINKAKAYPLRLSKKNFKAQAINYNTIAFRMATKKKDKFIEFTAAVVNETVPNK